MCSLYLGQKKGTKLLMLSLLCDRWRDKEKKLNCGFVDCEEAFGTVPQEFTRVTIGSTGAFLSRLAMWA